MIQYPKTSHLTLPSVVGGFGTLNIQRDPPKGMFTKFRPKVGDTSEITDWQGHAGSRVDCILVYPRGRNPMVGCSYDNFGTNGGQMRYQYGPNQPGGLSSQGGQAFLPYRIMRDGDFRPPIIAPTDLLPLSRQPRLTTSYETNPGSELSAVSALTKCGTDLRAVRQQLLQVCAAPTAIFRKEMPQTVQPETADAVRMARNIAVVAAVSQQRGQSAMPGAEVHYSTTDALRGSAGTNLKAQSGALNVNETPDRGVKDTIVGMAHAANLSRNANGTIVRNGEAADSIQDRLRGAFASKLTGQAADARFSNDIELDRPLPHTAWNAPCGNATVDKSMLNTDRVKRLPQRAPLGGFANAGVQPVMQRPHLDIPLTMANNVFLSAGRAQRARGS